MLKRALLVAGILAGLCALPAHAQTASAVAVSACGTPPVTYTAGKPYPVTQTTTGKSCMDATISASVAVAPLTSTNLSGTISVTDTFQSIQVSSPGRNGCSIQNVSGNGDPMYVFFGAVASATKDTSFKVADGQTISCAVGTLGVLTDEVSITGTAADVFVANFE